MHAHSDDAPPSGLLPDAASPALEERALAALRQLDPHGSGQLLARVLATYRDSLRRLVSQLQAALSGQDLAALRLCAHTLKSSSASVGARRLSSSCAVLEAQTRQDAPAAPAQLSLLVARVVDEAARVDDAVMAALAAEQREGR